MLFRSRTHRVTAKIERGARLVVEQDGKPLGSWPMTVVPDMPPTVEFAQPPKKTARAALQLEYHATDDYGLASVAANIRRQKPPEGVTDTPIEVAMQVPGLRSKDSKGQSFTDLTAHPWAGLPVLIQLRATDGVGQVGTSEDVEMVLPEREFNHPIAKAIVEQRKVLEIGRAHV